MEATIQSLGGEMVYPTPEPGSIWTKEEDNLRWLYIAQDGNHAVRVTIRKSTGKVISVDMEGWIGKECREIK